MRLVRFDPFRDITSMQDRMSRLFGNMPRQTGGDETTWGAWVPAVDIFEKEDCLVLKAELPGMREKDINVHVENGILTLHGERMHEERALQAAWHRRPLPRLEVLPRLLLAPRSRSTRERLQARRAVRVTRNAPSSMCGLERHPRRVSLDVPHSNLALARKRSLLSASRSSV